MSGTFWKSFSALCALFLLSAFFDVCCNLIAPSCFDGSTFSYVADCFAYHLILAVRHGLDLLDVHTVVEYRAFIGEQDGRQESLSELCIIYYTKNYI